MEKTDRKYGPPGAQILPRVAARRDEGACKGRKVGSSDQGLLLQHVVEDG